MARQRSEARSLAKTLWLGALLLTTACLGHAYQEAAQKAKALVPVHDASVSVEEVTDEPFLITSLDGKVTALDQATGQQLWTFDTDSPLLSTSGTQAYAFAIVPGVQGELYSQQRVPGGGFQLLPQTLPQWVDATPSLMADGSLWLGSRHTHAFFIDAATGKLIKSYVEYGEGPMGNSVDVADLPAGVRPILLGRVDYTVRAIDQETGAELFNVSYSNLRRMDSAAAPAPHLPDSQQASSLSLDPSAPNTVQRLDSTGRQLWSHAFEQPPVTAFSGGGAGAMLQPPLGSTSRAQINGKPKQPSILVDRINGSYYALPLAESKPQGLKALLPAEPDQQESSVTAAAIQFGKEALEAAGHGLSLGVHVLDATPSLLAAVKQGPNISLLEGEAGVKTAVGNLGMVALSLFAGASIAVVWLFARIVEKPRVVATIMEQSEEEVRTLKLSYTGTTQEAEAQRSEKAASGKLPRGTIHDFTGSGKEHVPESDSNPADSQGTETPQEGQHSPFSDVAGEAMEGRAGMRSSDDSAGKRTDQGTSDGSDMQQPDRPGRSRTAGPRATTESPRGLDWSPVRRPERRSGVTFIGRLAIGPGIVGYGSGGTLVFEGSLDGRPVAVKRVLRQFYELARKEIAALIVADEHPNIVRCFAMEEDAEFVYLALERCKQSLDDRVRGDSAAFLLDGGRATDLCLRICKEAGQGLSALHERGIVHRDLKPHNVLLTEGNRAKLSDMGLCKRLTTDQTSYDSAGPGGSTGWQAPEQLILRAGGEARQGRSVDIFAYGLLLFYCLTGGQHAFGSAYERDYRILNGKADLTPLQGWPEALSLIRALLRPQARQRPSMAAVMAHPFWWTAAKKLAFLIDVSNRVENEDREEDQSLLRALEARATEAIGGPNWAARLDSELLANLGRYRKYNPGSLRDLLRVIRNKHNHFREMPEPLQQRLSPLPDGFLRYFLERFPGLVMAVHSFGLEHCSQEPQLGRYFPAAAQELRSTSTAAGGSSWGSNTPTLETVHERTASAPAATGPSPGVVSDDEVREATQRSKSESALLPPPAANRHRRPAHNVSQHRTWWSSSESDSETSSGSERTPQVAERQLAGRQQQGMPPFQMQQNGARHTPEAAKPPVPRPPPAAHSRSPLEEASRSSQDGVMTVANALAVKAVPPGVKSIQDPEGFVPVFPQRPGGEVADCDFYLRTGHCKFGDGCRFHHPLTAAVKLTREGAHPLRPGQPVCPFYDRTGMCKYAASCKFHHPPVMGIRTNGVAAHGP